MLGTSAALLLLALAAIRLPDLAFLAILPAVAGAALAATREPDRGGWAAGILAAALLARLPGSWPLALVTALAPLVAWLLRHGVRIHPLALSAACIPLAAYAASAAGSGSLALPLRHLTDLCAAAVVGATLSAIAYASAQGERLGPGGRARPRLRRR